MSKRLRTIIFVVLILVIVVSVKSIFKSNDKEIMQDKKIPYRVVEKRDISTGTAKRYVWSVAVDDKISAEELEALSKEIIEEAKKEQTFNAIAINFYDYEEYIGDVYTLGQAEYAPEGDWAKADTVKPGDYKNMDYKFDLREKDWNDQLSQDEVDIYKAWRDLYEEKTKEVDLPDEDEIGEEISKKFGIKVEEVKNINSKQITWAFSDKNE